MNRWLISGILVAMAAVGVVPWLRFWKAAPEPPAAAQAITDDNRPHVEIAHPQRKTIHRKLKVAGEVRPNQEVGIYARVQGYVEQVHADRGDWIQEGQALVTISVPELEKQLAKEKAERDWRKTSWERLEAIAKKSPNLINQELLDDAKGRYEVAQAEVGRTQAMVEFAVVKAPFNGVVTERWIDRGHLVQPGSTKMLHLVQGDVVRIRVHISQSDVPSVRADCNADVTIDELPGRHFQSRLSRVFWGLNRETKTMAVEIDIRNEHTDRGQWVRPGMFARVTIDLDPRPNVLVIPASALVVDKKKTFGFVVKDGVAKRIALEVGLDNGIEIEVTKGVEETDDVVVTGKNLISDGDKVRVTRK